MKHVSALFTATALLLVLALPAYAIDHTWGGYWRTRAYTQSNFTGEDDIGAQDLTQVDSRTRLYYTATFSDDFKFVNKFEFDVTYGDEPQGDIGADGISLEVKNSYIDFSTWNKTVNWRLGVQGYTIGRGFVFDDDFAGAVIKYTQDNWSLPVVWIKHHEGGTGQNKNDEDVDSYTLNPYFKRGNWMFNPFLVYLHSDDGSAADRRYRDINAYYLGANVDYKGEHCRFWGTGIYNGGTLGPTDGTPDLDLNGFLVAMGVSGTVKTIGLHSEVFYASGDDNFTDDDQRAFLPFNGVSYYWAEIMGKGVFDNQVSANSPGNLISNIWAVNGGADYRLLENLKLTFDIWYASLVEASYAAADDDVLGTELDAKATYTIMPGLNLDLVAAYLFRGDGTHKGSKEADPYELGARLALSF